VRVTLVDGKFHQVDSNDMAFQIAGSMAIRKGALDAGPVLLEPVVEADIRVPEKNLGAIMSDINGRRGKILGTEPDDGYENVRAAVPEHEMLRFALDLRSITQGRGSFAKKFIAENESGRKEFARIRKAESELQIEKVGAELRKSMPFLDPVVVVDGAVQKA